MKKLLAMLMTMALTAGVLTACGNTTVVQQGGGEQAASETEETAQATETEAGNEAVSGDAVKTGISIVTTLEGENAGADTDGYATSNISVVAVTVGDDGVIG